MNEYGNNIYDRIHFSFYKALRHFFSMEFNPDWKDRFISELDSLLDYIMTHAFYNAHDAVILAIDEGVLNPNEGRICVEMFYNFRSSEIEIHLKDNGIGIRKKILEIWRDELSTFPYRGFQLTTNSSRLVKGGQGLGVRAFLWPDSYEFSEREHVYIHQNIDYTVIYRTKSEDGAYELSFPPLLLRVKQSVRLKEIIKSERGTTLIARFLMAGEEENWPIKVGRKHFEQLKRYLPICSKSMDK